MKRKARSKPEPVVTPEDAELFRDAIGEVRRIEVAPPAPAPPPPPPRARRFEQDEVEALRESQRGGDLPPEGDELLAFRRDHVSERTLRRLKRGEYATQDELDLHHLRAPDAEGMLKQFLNEARAGSRQCVRIIHGKGLRSEGAPVLKVLVDRVLRQRGDVLAFASAPAAQGGAGAVLALLDTR
jgi:DNA-nicking Smr family endonuclease